MRRLAYLLGFFAVFLSACGSQANKPDNFIDVAPFGTIEADDFVSLFSETCITHFPDWSAISDGFKKSGFRVGHRIGSDHPDNMRFLHPNKDLSARTGPATTTFVGPNVGGASLNEYCTVSALLKNPEELGNALKKLSTMDGEEIKLGNDPTYVDPAFQSGRYKNSNGATVEVTANQRLTTILPRPDLEWPDTCTADVKCRSWNYAVLGVNWAASK